MAFDVNSLIAAFRNDPKALLLAATATAVLASASADPEAEARWRSIFEEQITKEGYNAEELMPPPNYEFVVLGAGDYAKLVSDSLAFVEKNGKLHFLYSQPEMPEDLHLTVSLSIYNSAGAEIDRYVSDAGWKSDASKYSAAKRDYDITMSTANLNSKDAAVAVYVYSEPEDRLVCINYVQFPAGGERITTVRFPQEERGL